MLFFTFMEIFVEEERMQTLVTLEKNYKKKQLTFRNPKLVESLIDDDAILQNSTESEIVENLIVKEYISNIEVFRNAVVRNIYDDDFVRKCTSDIFSYFAAFPDRADGCLLQLVEYVLDLETWTNSAPTGNEPEIKDIKTLIGRITTILEKCKKREIEYPSPGINGRIFIDDSDINSLKYTQNDIDDPTITKQNEILGTLIIIRKYWFVGCEDTDQICTCSATFRLLASLARLSDWKTSPQTRSRLVKLLKSLSFGETNHKTIRGSKKILLKNKILLTTKDVIIMKQNINKELDEFTDALRVIHGPGGEKTKNPILFVFEGDRTDATNQLMDIVKQYELAEFPDPTDAFAVPIMLNGEFTDERICWEMI